jgi:two-component system, CitB family, response regulator CitT
LIKVIIAEDDFRVASIHEQFLETIDNVEVVGKALNAAETMKLLERNTVNLLLLDNYMPDKLGCSLLPEIRMKFPEIDIIMITAATEKDVVERSIRNGVIDYIIKPVTIERFVQAIEKYQRRKTMLEKMNELDQKQIDQFLSYQSLTTSTSMNDVDLPKGIDPLTLQKVKETLRSLPVGINAEEIGEQLGASRTTARRYLEYLISVGEAKAELEYGIVGRPERKYYIVF